MPDIPDLRCNVCGQCWRLQKIDEYNKRAPKFCPICGTESLSRETGQFGLGAACFKGVNPQLVTMLYANWGLFDKMADPTVQQPDRFIDYLKGQLEG